MIHPVLRLVASQPELLAEQACAYASLFSEEMLLGSTELKRRLMLYLSGTACLMVAAVLTGVAILLWCSLPAAGDRAPWLFVLTPALPAHAGLWILWLAHRRDPAPLLTRLKLQLAQDAEVLRAWSRP